MWITRSANSVVGSCFASSFVRYLSNKSAIVTKIRRKVYLRTYPTLLVNPDGSTLTIRHYEPRKIIKLPLDLSTVSEEERADILQRRKPVKKVEVAEEIRDNFSNKDYLKILRRRAN